MLKKEEFIEQQLKLLEMELDVELYEKRQYSERYDLADSIRRGYCISQLRCSSINIGLFQRILVKFSNSIRDKEFYSHQLTVGDIVGLYEGKFSSQIGYGVIYSIGPSEVIIAFDKRAWLELDDECDHYHIIKLINDVAYQRLKKALFDLKKIQNCRLASVILDEQKISSPIKIGCVKYFNSMLDESQKQAVIFALEQREVALIHGPPGTGKTTTVVEIILQLTKRGNKVLVCAPSNIAVDNLGEKLAIYAHNSIVRFGHPVKANSDLKKFTLDAIISRSDQSHIIEDIRKELYKFRVNMKSEIKELRKELKDKERSAIETALTKCNIVLSTLTSASIQGPVKYLSPKDGQHRFDVVIIDECSQALESACWIVLPHGKKCIIVGDHFQLPPNIISKKAGKAGLKMSLVERLLKRKDCNELGRMLTVQYRMNHLIMEWASKNFYENKLIAHSSVRDQKLSDISNCNRPVLLLIDTAGFRMRELNFISNDIRGNEGEADLVAIYVEKLIYNGVKIDHIGVISPYNCQVDLIRLRLSKMWPTLEIKTVEGFQGREKEVIVLSLVKSNEMKDVGSLNDWRRINVAVTRAKRHLVVICDSETICSDSHLSSLVDHIFKNGEVEISREYWNKKHVKYHKLKRPYHLKF